MSDLHLFIFGGLIIAVTLILVGIIQFTFRKPATSLLVDKQAYYIHKHTGKMIKVELYGSNVVYISDANGARNISYVTLEDNYNFVEFIK